MFLSPKELDAFCVLGSQPEEEEELGGSENLLMLARLW